MKKSCYVLWIICVLWTLYHASFFHLNEILKVADSFAYLQMSYFLESLSQKWLWNWWFGFVYSLPIALINIFLWNDFLSAKIVNLILLNISAFLLWKISRKVLSESFSYLAIILFFLSPTFLHFNIHVLSENIYTPLFLAVFYLTWDFVENLPHKDTKVRIKHIISISCLLWLMYLTRAEAFIYLWSIWILSIWLLLKKKISYKSFIGLWWLFLLTFFIFISPYLLHLHSVTGEWWLTNKWASNLRQAELRGQEKMDDSGFEKAVAELSPDNFQLIAGFAGGMDYVKPQIEWNLWEFISKNPKAFVSRVAINQRKLFTRNIPEIFLGKSPKLYFSDDSRFSSIFFLIFSLFPLTVLMFGIYQIFQKKKLFAWLTISFFIPALFFFTLFFTLNRYFLIFLPLLFVIFCYGLQSLHYYKKYTISLLIGNIITVFLLSTSVYYNMESPKDTYYELKKQAGLWLQENKIGKLKLMERFPITTYYSWAKTRFITPYTDNIQDIYEYGTYNNIDILVVDTMDFQTYRPLLKKYISETPENFEKLQEFSNQEWQKVILYTLKK